MTAVVNDLSKRWSGQGSAASAQRDANGVPGPFFGLGRVPTIQLSAKLGMYEERDTETGTRALMNRIPQTKDVEGSLEIESYTPADLARYFYGEAAVKAQGTVTAESLGTLVADQTVYLDNRKVSSLVLSDSAVTPATLAAGTAYATPSAADLVFGRLRILDVTGLTMPVKAAYSYAASVVTGLLTDAVMREHTLRIEMVNTHDNSHLLIVLYRVQFDSDGMRDLITEKGVGKSKLKFSALIDTTKASDAALGQFGFIEHL